MTSDPAVQPQVDRRTRRLALASAVVPPLAWVVAFYVVYTLHDFACFAAASAARPTPGWGLRALLLLVWAVTLVATVLAGLGGYRAARSVPGDRPGGPWWFLSWAGVTLALVFGFGTVLVGLMVVMLEVCW